MEVLPLAKMSKAAETSLDSVIVLEKVTISRPRYQFLSIGSTIISLDSSIINQSRNLSLPDVLSYVGLQVNNYGQGGLSTIAIRGLSPSHTAIVWDDINLQSPMNGQFNLSTIPVSLIDNASIQYGGSGVNYGSGSMTGIIHLENSNLINQINNIWISPAMGSYGNQSLAFGSKIGNNKLAASLKLFTQKSDNDFSFKNTTDFYQRTIQQTNAGMKQIGILPQFMARTSNKSVLKSSCWFQQYNKNIQTMMTSTTPNRDNQKDKNCFIDVQWKYIDSAFIFSAKSAYLYNQIVYTDQNNTTTYNSSQSYIIELEDRILLGKSQWLQIGLNNTSELAFSDSYSSHPQRNRTSLFSQYKIENIHNRLNLMVGLREEYISYFSPIVYDLGMEYRINKWLGMHGNYSRNYHIPTMNDLYWKEDAYTRGNKDLKPETGWSTEVGLEQKYNKNNFQLTFSQTLFYNKISNWIIWLPDPLDKKWQPENKEKGKSEGIEIREFFNYTHGNLTIHNYSAYFYTYARTCNSDGKWNNTQLDYVPLHRAVFNTSIDYKNFSFGYIQNYTGIRYSLETQLEPYQVADLFCNYSLRKNHFKTTLQFRINNLWNKFYQVRQYYAMPLRNYLITLTFNFNTK
jgi:outer membrane cobalamin receptor